MPFLRIARTSIWTSTSASRRLWSSIHRLTSLRLKHRFPWSSVMPQIRAAWAIRSWRLSSTLPVPRRTWRANSVSRSLIGAAYIGGFFTLFFGVVFLVGIGCSYLVGSRLQVFTDGVHPLLIEQ